MVRVETQKYWRVLWAIAILFTPLMAIAQSGPGGVGKTNGKSGLVMWLRADHQVYAGKKQKPANEQQAKKWKDISGNGVQLTQPKKIHRPTYIEDGINGHPVLKFNRGEKDFLKTTQFKGLMNKNNYTVFIMAQTANLGGQVLLSGVESKQGRGKTGLYIAKPKNSIHPRMRGRTNIRFTHRCPFRLSQKTGSNIYTTSNSVDNDNPDVLSFVRRGPGKQQKVRVNGQEVKQKVINNSANQAFKSPLDLTIGTLADWMNTMNLHGKVAEIIIYNRALSKVEVKTVEKYLQKRYGIQPPKPVKKEGEKKESRINTPSPVKGLKGMGKVSQSISSFNTGGVKVSNVSYLNEQGDFLFMGFKRLEDPNSKVDLMNYSQVSQNVWWIDIEEEKGKKANGVVVFSFEYDRQKGNKPGNSDNYRFLVQSPGEGKYQAIPVQPVVNGHLLKFTLDMKTVKKFLKGNQGWLVLASSSAEQSPLPSKLSPGESLGNRDPQAFDPLR